MIDLLRDDMGGGRVRTNLVHHCEIWLHPCLACLLLFYLLVTTWTAFHPGLIALARNSLICPPDAIPKPPLRDKYYLWHAAEKMLSTAQFRLAENKCSPPESKMNANTNAPDVLAPDLSGNKCVLTMS